MSDTLFMETTKIDPNVTIGEIQKVLACYGCQAVMTEYGAEGEVEAVSFRVSYQGKLIAFKLPSRWEPVFKVLNSRRTVSFQVRREEEDKQQAKRVAWRQILRWVQAQLALVQTNMVTIIEVFLPYAHGADGKTLYERIQQTHFAALEYHPTVT